MPNTNTTTTAFQPALKVNSGTPKPTEVQLWKGNTTWQVNGKKLVANVSADRTWYWVRFEGRDEMLPPEYHAQMAAAGFYWGKKPRNLGYFGASSPEKVALLRGMGYHQAQHIEEPIVAPVTKVKANVEHPAQVEPKGKKTSTPTGKSLAQNGKHYIAYNAAGRAVWADTGYFVSAAEMVGMGITRVDPKPTVNGHVVHEDGESVGYDDVDPTDAYQFGFEMGRHDRDNGASSKDVWLQGYEAGLKPDPEVVANQHDQDTDLREMVLMLAAQQQDQAKRFDALLQALASK